MSNGYVVESFADAPMRVRAWFENEDDAREYAGKLGASAYMHAGEASYEVAASVVPRLAAVEQHAVAMIERAEKKKVEATEAEIEDLESEIEDLQDRLSVLRSKRRAA